MELTFIFGPPLALGLAALWSPRAALAGAGLMLLTATAAFATRPASRSWRPAPATRRPRAGSLRAPAIRTLAAGGLALILTALALGHAALAAATGSMLAIGAVLLVAGAAIAPAYATIYAMADHAAPAGTVTEAFAWLSTAVVAGASAGAAGGALAQSAGPGAAFALAGLAGALAVAVTLLRSRTVNDQVVIPASHNDGGPGVFVPGLDPAFEGVLQLIEGSEHAAFQATPLQLGEPPLN